MSLGHGCAAEAETEVAEARAAARGVVAAALVDVGGAVGGAGVGEAVGREIEWAVSADAVSELGAVTDLLARDEVPVGVVERPPEAAAGIALEIVAGDELELHEGARGQGLAL